MNEKYEAAYEMALILIGQGCEPTSALREAATNHGIPYGDEMEAFMMWAERRDG